ncbi:hypothetical protein PR002_g32406 [Phytophthora rubi]|nr:hypothetical protein PR002_g32406 [Phytophthora rubi]
MEDIPDVVKEYEVTLALIFDDSSSEDDHDLVSFIAHEYPRHESLSNDDAMDRRLSAQRLRCARPSASSSLRSLPDATALTVGECNFERGVM